MSAAIGRVSTSKDTAGCESSAVSSSESSEAWEASKYCVLEEAGSDTSDNNKMQNWLQAVGVSVIAMYHLAYFAKFNSSRDVTGVLCFCHTHKMWFPWMIQRKNPCLILMSNLLYSARDLFSLEPRIKTSATDYGYKVALFMLNVKVNRFFLKLNIIVLQKVGVFQRSWAGKQNE